ncbi:MAG: hypothetical protein R2877_01730 [Bdellovibrionota bacterium]
MMEPDIEHRTKRGDMALQELLNHSGSDHTHSNHSLDPGISKKNPEATGYRDQNESEDKEGQTVKTQSTADALKWGGLINRVMAGDTMSVSTGGDSGFHNPSLLPK